MLFACNLLEHVVPEHESSLFDVRIDCAYRQAFSFGKGDDIALSYLKELRQNGTDRRTEMSTLISGGFLQYQAMKEAEEAEVTAIQCRVLARLA